MDGQDEQQHSQEPEEQAYDGEAAAAAAEESHEANETQEDGQHLEHEDAVEAEAEVELEKQHEAAQADERPASQHDVQQHQHQEVEQQSAKATATATEQHETAAKPSQVKEKSPSPQVSAADACRVCGKKVYPLEKLVAEKNLFHKLCFRCQKCNRTLTTSNYATLNGEYFCKPHQLELFRLQGRYELNDSRAEVVNRSSESPASDVQLSESSAEELRKARARFEKPLESPVASSPAQPEVTAAQYGGVGALKARYLASASQNAAAENNRPPPRKMTPPRIEPIAGGHKANGQESESNVVEHGEFENQPLRIDGVVRESDRGQFEAELPKQGTAKNALALFRNLESAKTPANATSESNTTEEAQEAD